MNDWTTKSLMQIHQPRPRRSVLYVPASNERALAKIGQLACDCIIIDLEDAVAPDDKAQARERMTALFAARQAMPASEMVIRINALSSPWGAQDLSAAISCRPDAILLPKVETTRDVLDANNVLNQQEADAQLSLWAMIETPRAVLNIGAIAELGRDHSTRLACLVAGTNDLVKDTRIRPEKDRRLLTPWLMQIVLAARAGNLDALDGVANNFTDLEAFSAECQQGRDMGFDGKTLIHPAQIEPANRVFSPSAQEVEAALAIRAAFAEPQNRNKGVISLDGAMVERLHLEQAEQLLAKAGY